VWCNGVIMHTAEPDKCLQEITRVLKPGGTAWIYVYGSGGIYWRIIEAFREITKDIAPEKCIAMLQLLGYETRFIAEYLDDWKVPFLRRYTAEDFSRRLTELGYDDVKPLAFGVSYDTSHRISTRPEEGKLWGEGDLRYLVTKARKPAPGDGHPISSGPQGSSYTYDAAIDVRFAPLLLELAGLTYGKPLLSVAACAFVQWQLRNEMTREAGFDAEEFAKNFHRAMDMIKLFERH
jgi:Methyltransferase domain